MIRKIHLSEKHKDVIQLEFGQGTIMFTKMQMEDVAFALAFNQSTPHKIGEETNSYAGKSVDEFDDKIEVLFYFTKPESITALVHSLIELQQAMYNGQL